MSTHKRIISLVPSLTELVLDLGLQKQLVGRTRFCVHPEEQVEEIPIIGGTKNPRLDKIHDLHPDCIIANKEENRREDIEALSEDFEVLITEIATIEDALITIHELGSQLGAREQAQEMISIIQQQLDRRPGGPELTTAYLIWKNPWMSIGHDTYIHDVLKHWNLTNIFADQRRYPKFQLQELNKHNPDLILLSSEPYPFKKDDLRLIEKICPASLVEFINGQWFSWYGSNMQRSFEQLNNWRKTLS